MKKGKDKLSLVTGKLGVQWGGAPGEEAEDEPKAQEKIRRFALPDVAPLAPPDRNDVTGMADREALRPFGLTASPDIPYPTREMVKALLDERTKPLNTALVLPDAPHDTYYVAVVAQRLEKNDADFSRSVYSETGASGARAAVRMAYAEDARRKTTESVLALLRQEFSYEIEGMRGCKQSQQSDAEQLRRTPRRAPPGRYRRASRRWPLQSANR